MGSPSKINLRLSAALAVFWAALIASAPLLAAGSTNDPGQIDRRLQERTEETLEDREDRAADPELPEVVPYAQPDGERFILTGVTVTGATVFDGAALAPFYEDYMATEVSQADLLKIADAVTGFYHDHGYTLSRAYIPPQAISAGVIELRIVEGYVEEIVLSGEAGGLDLEAYTKRILEERPLTQSTLERNLLLMHDLAGVSLNDIALAEAVEGSGVFTLNIATEYDPWTGSVYLDNRGTRAVGPLQLGLSATANSLMGTGEAITGAYYTSPNDPNELQYGQVYYLQPIGSDGFQLALTGSYSATEPDDAFAPVNRRGSSVYASLGLNYPLLRMRNESIWLKSRFDLRNTDDKTDLGIVSDDRLRVARLQVDYFRVDEWSGSNFISVGVAHGLDILGASGASHRFASRIDGEVQFTKIFADLYRSQGLWSDEWVLALRASGQKSSAPLLSSEEFGLGGARFGRAYEYGELTGDSGLAGSLELQYQPDFALSFLDDVTVYGFYDIGAIWDRHQSADLRRDSLASAGGGVRFRLMEQLNAVVEVAKPLTRDTSRSDDRSPQVHFSLAWQF